MLLNLALVVWGFGCMMVGFSKNPAESLFWWKIAHVGGVFTVCFILENVLAVTETKRTGFLFFAYAQATLFQVLSVANLLQVRMLYVYNSFYYIVPDGVGYPIFTFCFLLVCYYSAVILFNAFIHSQGQRRLQLKFHLIAFLFGIVGGTAHFFTVYNPNIFPYGSLLIPGFPLLATYAILKHKLLDIEVVIKKTLVFAGLFVATYAVFAFFAFLGQIFFERLVTSNRWVSMLPSVFVVTFMLRPLENFLINVTNKYLFQKKYDYKELLKTFTSEVLTVLDLDKLVNLTIDKLADIIKLNSCAVLLFDDEKQQFRVVASNNIKDSSVTLAKPDSIVTFLEQTHGYLLRKELIEKKVFIPGTIQEIIDKLRSELIIPMVLHEKVIGVLSLGKKKSDEDYTQDDLDILLPLARTLAIARSNAELFEELSKTQAEAAQREKMAVIGTLAAGMAHEIRNPITTIKIFAEYLKEKKDDPKFIEKFEELVPKEVEKINHMITHLLEFSKPADYKSMEPVSIIDALNDVLDILENEMALNDVVLYENIGNVPLVFGNRKYLQEIMFNLIQNAISAIGKRGKIRIEAHDIGRQVQVQIEDTGCGISEEHLKRIFEPFFTTKLDSKGVGLGLYVIRQLMLRMNGTITVESSIGKGTTFYLNFEKAAA